MTSAPRPRSPYADLNLAMFFALLLLVVGAALVHLVIPMTFCTGLAIAVIGAASATRRGALSIIAAFPLAVFPLWAVPAGDALVAVGMPDNPSIVFTILFSPVAVGLAIAWWRWWVGVSAMAGLFLGYGIMLQAGDDRFVPHLAAGAVGCFTLAPCYLAARQAVRERHSRDAGLCPHCRYDCRSLPAAASGQVLCPECGRPLPTPAPTPAPPT